MVPQPLGLAPSFGFGDRTGLATPGHVAAMERSGDGIAPIFPQQSIREMSRTNRTPEGVMADALSAAKSAGWKGITGADADHLKKPADVDVTAAAGFTFFTLDPSENVDRQADDYSASELSERFQSIAEFAPWIATYEGTSQKLSTDTTIVFDQAVVRRAAVKYAKAIRHAIELSSYVAAVHQRLGRAFEIELSVDETDQPTTLAEHWIIADQCLQSGMKLVSLAPRFIGDFEKGVDFKGDRSALARSLADHAAIAEALGPYKLSLHSGSDKLSMYADLARATKGRFHVKTAGTSYLEALRVVARHDAELFRRIVDFSRSRYDVDKATYHVSATLADAGPAADYSTLDALEGDYLGHWREVPSGAGLTQPGRQILHCTFGSVLTHAEFGPAVRQVLVEYPTTYRDVLADHFARHLDALRAGWPG